MVDSLLTHFPKALLSLEAIMQKGDVVHGKKWRGQSTVLHYHRAVIHLEKFREAFADVNCDVERTVITDEDDLGNLICRLLMLLQLREEKSLDLCRP